MPVSHGADQCRVTVRPAVSSIATPLISSRYRPGTRYDPNTVASIQPRGRPIEPPDGSVMNAIPTGIAPIAVNSSSGIATRA